MSTGASAGYCSESRPWPGARYESVTPTRQAELAYPYRKDGLSFSVAIFTLCAICTILILLLRRRSDPPAELGGDRKLAVATSAFLLFLWLMYILLSSLKAYEVELGIAPFGF